MTFNDYLVQIYKGDLSKVPDCLLCLDPGATTGWCIFEKGVLTQYGQTPTIAEHDTNPKIDWGQVIYLLEKTKPTCILCEDYRIYAQKLERHSFSKVPTLRLIGGIELLAYKDKVDIVYQMAVQAKGFVTDDKLKKWDFWKPGMRHSRDAIRHGIYYLFITNRPK